MDERLWFALGTALSLLSSGWGAYALGAGRTSYGHSRWNYLLLGLAWGAQSVFLYQRGQHTGHCPLSNLFETVGFLTWALLLTYLVIGTSYRVSLLGFFTAPVVSLINFFALVCALIAPIDRPNPLPVLGWALELHASLSLMAYGALGLAAVDAFLYLVQERYLKLKGHSMGQWFDQLPSLADLGQVQRRVLAWGFFLLTIGLGAGFFVHHNGAVDWVKVIWSAGIWLVYLLLLIAPWAFRVSARRIAWCSLAGYLFILLTFWGINSLSHSHRFAV